MSMTDTHPTPNALDALVAELLDCGGALSQIVDHMHAFGSSGLASPDVPPILEVAHSVIRSVLGEVSERHSEEPLRRPATSRQTLRTGWVELRSQSSSSGRQPNSGWRGARAPRFPAAVAD